MIGVGVKIGELEGENGAVKSRKFIKGGGKVMGSLGKVGRKGVGIVGNWLEGYSDRMRKSVRI
ncbi:hypothetical protein, partial [Staphylococcus epidermidis]|uniref:hypothetical protein n=1 Tax=Staphylococcus epidermidis TaxID=1282 RepID=UPI001C92D6CB